MPVFLPHTYQKYFYYKIYNFIQCYFRKMIENNEKNVLFICIYICYNKYKNFAGESAETKETKELRAKRYNETDKY